MGKSKCVVLYFLLYCSGLSCSVVKSTVPGTVLVRLSCICRVRNDFVTHTFLARWVDRRSFFVENNRYCTVHCPFLFLRILPSLLSSSLSRRSMQVLVLVVVKGSLLLLIHSSSIDNTLAAE